MHGAENSFMTVLKFILFLFAVYGLITLIFSLIEMIPARPAHKFGKYKLVLLTKNSQDNIEFAVSNILKNKLVGWLDLDKSLTVVDMGSTDETFEVLKRMERNSENLNVVEFKQREKIFDII
jgi:hypothetical protein